MEINFITFLSYTRQTLTELKNWRCLVSKMLRVLDVFVGGKSWNESSPPCRFAVSLKIIASTLRMYHVYAVKINQIKVNSFHSRRYRVSLKERKVRNVLLFLRLDSRKRRFLLYIRTGRHLNLTVSGSRHRQLDFRDRMRRSKEILSVPRKFCWGQDTRWSTLKVDERYHGVNGVPRN